MKKKLIFVTFTLFSGCIPLLSTKDCDAEKKTINDCNISIYSSFLDCQKKYAPAAYNYIGKDCTDNLAIGIFICERSKSDYCRGQ